MMREYVQEEGRPLNILQIAPPVLPISPKLQYAGTERNILYLDEVYTRMGHNSIVAATGDSEIKGKLYPTLRNSFWNVEDNTRIIPEEKSVKKQEELHYKKVLDYILNNNVDVIHDHLGSGFIDSEAYRKTSQKIKPPILTTLHGDYMSKSHNEWTRFMDNKEGIFFNAISHSQKEDFERNLGVNIEEVIYHGIPLSKFPFRQNPHNYLFSLGNIAKVKGQHLAAQIAKESGMSLIIGGDIHSINQDYWENQVYPYLDFSVTDLKEDERGRFRKSFMEELINDGDTIENGKIIYIGSLNDKEKAELYKRAKVFLMPIHKRKEPFGLVMIESMATGTPVVAFEGGAVSEVVEDGKTGYVIPESGNDRNNLEQMVSAINNIENINRKECRNRVENHFTIEQEAKSYIDLYKRLILG